MLRAPQLASPKEHESHRVDLLRIAYCYVIDASDYVTRTDDEVTMHFARRKSHCRSLALCNAITAQHFYRTSMPLARHFYHTSMADAR